MEQPIGRKAHGFTDYSYIPLVSTAPKTMGFEDEPAAVLMTKVLSGGILASSLVTRAEWGLFNSPTTRRPATPSSSSARSASWPDCSPSPKRCKPPLCALRELCERLLENLAGFAKDAKERRT